MQFAATACTIVSGAIAERARFESYLLYSGFMAAWVYPIIAHASWSPSGWVGMFRCAFSLHEVSGTRRQGLGWCIAITHAAFPKSQLRTHLRY